MIKSFFSNQRLIKIIYPLVLVFTFFIIYISIFDKKISLVGDNASYYILGNAIANGEGYTNIQHAEKEAHYHYPPGYPLLIASAIKLFSNKITSIKLLNGILLLGVVLLLFLIITELTKNPHIAFATGIITLVNYHILVYSTIMMSEIPFLFFSMCCLWFFLKLDYSKPFFKNAVLGIVLICLSLSFYIRSIGIAMFCSLLIFFVLKKRWTYAVGLISGFILLYIPWIVRNRNTPSNSYLHQLSLKNPYRPELGNMNFFDLLERVALNAERYLTKEIPSSIFYAKNIIYSEASSSPTAWLLGIIIVVFVIYGISRLQKFRTFITLYLVAFFSILLVWPTTWYGIRFLLPIIPLLIFLFLFGITASLKLLIEKTFQMHQKFINYIFGILAFIVWTFAYGSKSISRLQNQATGIYTNNYQNYFAIANWIRENTSENSITCVRKENLFHLFSKKYVTGYLKTLDKEAQVEYLKQKNVDYVVVEQLGYSSTYNYLLPTIDRYPKKFKLIKELKNPNTYLMQFLPELGYWGEWHNNERNGWGTYIWEDGQKYIGCWKNNVRHGEGTVYFTNGEQLSGVWNTGKLNGSVIKKSSYGRVIEKSIYENNLKVIVINEFN